MADALDVSRFTGNQIINGHRAITADMAFRLSFVLGTSPDLRLDMQKRVDLFEACRRLEKIEPKLERLREAESEPSIDDV